MLRRMQMARLGDGRIVFHNAVPLDEASMDRVEAWGTPAFLIVPNAYHRLDIHAFKARYPGMKLLCPAPARTAVSAVAAVDGNLSLLPSDSELGHEPIRGTKSAEEVLISRSGSELSLLFGDAVFNLPHLPGIDGAILRMIGTTGGPRVTWIGRMLMVSDRGAFADHLDRLAALPGLCRLVPSHGTPITTDAPSVLRDVAGRLRGRATTSA
jgi:hypothetical protein